MWRWSCWRLRFVQDDAYISFRYARNLVEGHGLVFQPGDRVQGFTNPLWTLLMAIPISAGQDPVVFSQVLGIACLGWTTLLTFHLARLLLGTVTRAGAAVLVLIGTATFTAYGTGGLETPLQTALVTAVALLAMKVLRAGTATQPTLVAISVLAGAAMLTRLDSVVLVGAWAALVLFGLHGRSEDPPPRPIVRDVVLLGLPALLMVGSWSLWAWSFYGSPLPNTFVAKSGGWTSLMFGAEYLVLFAASYGLILLLPAVRSHGGALRSSSTWRPVLIVAGAWVLYVLVVGGDFMEFRFMVPVLPLVACLVAYLLCEVGRTQRVLLIVVLGVFSLLHLLVRWPVWMWISSFKDLDSQVSAPAGRPTWTSVGETLADQFPGGATAPGQVTIAVGAAGAIPYFSDLPTVDLLGLNDAWVAANGERTNTRPGHLVRAPIAYLEDRGVNLLIDTPGYVRTGARSSYTNDDVRRITLGHTRSVDELPDGAQVLEIPVTNDKSVPTILLASNPLIDAKVASGELRLVPIQRGCDALTSVRPAGQHHVVVDAGRQGDGAPPGRTTWSTSFFGASTQ